MLRHEIQYNGYVKVELLNMDWMKAKTFVDLKKAPDQGLMVFAENADLKSTRFDNFKWNKALTMKENIFKLYVNVGQGFKYDKDTLEVKIMKTKTLAELK